jgi:hypothetical protein
MCYRHHNYINHIVINIPPKTAYVPLAGLWLRDRHLINNAWLRLVPFSASRDISDGRDKPIPIVDRSGNTHECTSPGWREVFRGCAGCKNGTV